MSKRFGRNQKRKLKQAVADAQYNERLWADKVVAEQRTVLYEQNKNARAKYLMAEFVRQFGKNHPLYLEIFSQGFTYYMDRIHIAQMDDVSWRGRNSSQDAMLQVYEALILEPIKYGINPADERRKAMIQVKMPGLDTLAITVDAYRINSSALEYLLTNELVPHIVREARKTLRLDPQ